MSKERGRPRKKKNVSEKIKENYLSAARKLKKQFGYSVEEALLRMMYEPKIQDAVRASIMKTYNEAMIIKHTESKITKTNVVVPSIYLPKMAPDPALVVLEGGASKKKKGTK